MRLAGIEPVPKQERAAGNVDEFVQSREEAGW
jgi:hypothetical protein